MMLKANFHYLFIYKIVDMEEAEFNDYIDVTTDDWIASNYEGVIYQCKKIQPFA